MKIKSIIIAISIIGIAIAFGYFVYFVSGVSAVLPSIKQYEYSGDAVQLIAKIRAFTSISKQPKLTFKVDDVVGNKSNGYTYQMSLIIKDNNQNLLYELNCSNLNKTNFKTKLELIGAHNLKNNTGGYGIKADGMNNLLNQFNSNVIAPLKNRGVMLVLSK